MTVQIRSFCLLALVLLVACEANEGASSSDVVSDARPDSAVDTEEDVCVPNCTNRECGPDPDCGVSCGECGFEVPCLNGVCLGEYPNCSGLECGLDSSCPGFYCGENGGNCLSGECNADGSCECVPDCAGRVCGDDGCGGSCGSCEPFQECVAAGVRGGSPCVRGTACFDWFPCAQSAAADPEKCQAEAEACPRAFD